MTQRVSTSQLAKLLLRTISISQIILSQEKVLFKKLTVFYADFSVRNCNLFNQDSYCYITSAAHCLLLSNVVFPLWTRINVVGIRRVGFIKGCL